MTEQELIEAIRLSDRKWQKSEEAYKRRRKLLTQELQALTVDLILFYQNQGYTPDQIKEIFKGEIYS